MDENTNTNNEPVETTEDARAAAENDRVTETNDDAKFTQADVDRIVAERLSRATKKAAEPPKTDAKTARTDANDQREEAEAVAKSQASENTEEFKQLKTEVDRMKAENIALRLGVPDENLEKVLKLAAVSDETDQSKAISAVLDEFPMLKGDVEPEKPKKAGSPAKAGKTETEPANLHDAIAAAITSKK